MRILSVSHTGCVLTLPDPTDGHLAAIASGIIGAAGIAAAALISVDPSTFTSSSPPVSPLKSAGESLPLVADTTADSTAAPIVAADVPKVEEVKSAVESTPAPVVAEDKAVVAEESKLSEVPVIGAAVVGATAVLGGAAVMGQKALASVGSGEKAATTLDESAKVGATKVQDTIPASASGGFGSSTAKALGLEKEFAATATPAPTIANPTIATAVTPVGQEHLKPIVPLLPLNENLVNNASETQAIPTPVVPALESNLPATVVAPTPVVAAVTPTPTPAAASAAVVDAPVSNDAAPAIPVKDGLPPVAAAVAAPASTPVKETLGKKAGKALKDAEANGDASSTRTKKSSFMSKMKRAFGGGKKDKKQPPMPVAAAPAATTAAQDVQSDDR